MPETKQLTAMMMLRDRLQEKKDSIPNEYFKAVYQDIIDIINTELLAVERQQIEQAYTIGYENINITAEDYYNQTFNTK